MQRGFPTTEVLRRKGVTIFSEHFHHNKEHWRQRLRMPTPPCDQHAREVSFIHGFVRINPSTKEYYT